MKGRAAIVALWAVAAPLLALLSPVSAAAQQAEPATLAGTYDGSQTELAAWLELGEDGRYRYALSYGALDEFSSGTWTHEDGGIVLQSDPSTPPKFELLGVEAGTGTPGALTFHLENTGTLPLALFSAIVEHGDGTRTIVDFDNGTLVVNFAPGDQVLTVSLALPMYEIGGEPVTVAEPSGKSLYFKFDANDLGVVSFNNAFLPDEDGALLLERYGRKIEFRKDGSKDANS
jgi:hypothetical protein